MEKGVLCKCERELASKKLKGHACPLSALRNCAFVVFAT